jgi:hypothetical protein
LNKPNEASIIVQKFQSGDFPLQAVDHEILREAANLFKPLASKKIPSLMRLWQLLPNGSTPMLFLALMGGIGRSV